MPEGRRQREPAPSSPTPGLRAAAGGLRPARLGGADGGSRSPGGKGEGQEPRGFLTWLMASIALHEGRCQTRDTASRLGDPGPWGHASHLHLPPRV